MSHSPPIQIDVLLSVSDYRSYVRAARLIARIKKADAPTAVTLIEALLAGRDATGVADDYLDSIGWPLDSGRVITLRRPRPQSKRKGQVGVAQTRKGLLHLAQPLDPTRN